MKAGIHPVYKVAKVVCACGNTFETRSTKELIKVEICAACHPFYTGQQRLVDTAGRVERFKLRFGKTDGKMVVRAPVKREIKKLVGAPAAKKRVLSTAPSTKDDAKAGKKDKKAKKA
ncbi:MAG: 50S ribosomal protein L31 [Elusimicrobia bacterium]|nr:50S ribosomal protein L31 [Elusimicrobiota bacterium]